MACDATTAFLTAETGRYMPTLERRVFPKSILMNLHRRGEWMPAMGVSINTLVYERSAPTEAEPTWTAINSIPDGVEGGSCLPPVTKISVASTARSFNLARRTLEGPDICNIDIMPVFDLQNQLASAFGILGDYTRIEWEIRYRHEYFRLVQTKVVADASYTTTTTMATTYPASAATKPLNWKILRKLTIDLMRDGAGAEALIRSNGEPLATVITDSETAGNITRQNDKLRDDIRWGSPNVLLTTFGVTERLQNIVFLVDPFPRRFEYSGGYVEVPAFSLTVASKGQKAIVNASWKTATYTEHVIFDPGVVTFLIPRPPVAPHPNFRFDPVNFTGAVQLKNIIDRVCNPDGTLIYHRMNMGAASMPNQPERGVAIVTLRCDPEGETTACAS